MTKKAQRTGDKWYKLAKQQGYRARSAFKLVQLNRQFNFLSKAHVLVDLCAAPGGWYDESAYSWFERSQVAAKQMPVESTIIAVDLMPMKPIHNVKTFQEDITTQKCRNVIKAELRGKSVWICCEMNSRLMLCCMMVLLMLEEVGIRMLSIRLLWNLLVIDRIL